MSFQAVIKPKIEEEFRDELWRTMLQTAYLRAQADDRWSTLLVNLGGVVGAVAPWALVLWTKIFQGQESTIGNLKAILNNNFVSSLLRSQLDLLKYPYDEHFTVNRVLLDAEGLKVRMGATTSATLVFEDGLEKQQSVSTFINIRTLTVITLSVVELQESSFNKRPTAGSSEFSIQFAYAGPQASDTTPAKDVYTLVGKAISFTLQAAKRPDGESLNWTLALKSVPQDNSASDVLSILLASFGKIEGANVLLVTRLDAPGLEKEERNTVAVEWE